MNTSPHLFAWSHATELAAEPAGVSVARAFVARHLRDHDVADLVDDVQLAVSELATNAIMHARTSFSVLLAGRDGSVRLDVGDGS